MPRADSSWPGWLAIWATESDWRANKSIVDVRWKNCADSNSSAPLGPREGQVIGLQLSEERDGQMTSLDLPAGSHAERPGGPLQFRGKIFERLVHIHPHALPARRGPRLPRQGHLWNRFLPPRRVDFPGGTRQESHAAHPRLIDRCNHAPTCVSSRDMSIARAECVSAPTEM